MAYLLGIGVVCNIVMLIIFLATTNNTCVEAARQFKVGDHFGWRVPDPNDAAFYTQWAERNRFQVGDSLGKFCSISSQALVSYYSLLLPVTCCHLILKMKCIILN